MQPPEADERAGHIPGAVDIEQVQTLTDTGTFKSYDELDSLFSRQGVTLDKEIFPYCVVGERSGYMWFVLTQLVGYSNVRNDDGSWSEWNRLPGAAAETKSMIWAGRMESGNIRDG